MATLPEILDLRQGNPTFLQEIFRDLLGIVEPITDFGYPDPEGDPELLTQLHHLFPQYSHIIVTNGATQALCAAMEFCGKQYGPYLFHHQSTWWSRIPTICERAGVVLINGAPVCGLDQSITGMHTSPNNPDGSIAPEDSVADIWDGSYFNPMYPVYAECKPVDIGRAGCAVFSGSKMLGAAGYRVGWLGTNNVKLAEYVTDYVDNTTVGVSVLSQKEVASILRHLRSSRYIKYFEKAQKILEDNHLSFEHKLSPFLDFKNNQGLYAWFKVKDFEKFEDALFECKISLMPGKAFGAKEDGWYRLNLGGTQDVLDLALDKLHNHLVKS